MNARTFSSARALILILVLSLGPRNSGAQDASSSADQGTSRSYYAELSTGIKAPGSSILLRGEQNLLRFLSARLEVQADRLADRDFAILAPGLVGRLELGHGIRWLSDFSILVSLKGPNNQNEIQDRLRVRSGLVGGRALSFGERGFFEAYGEVFALSLAGLRGWQGLGLLRSGAEWSVAPGFRLDAPFVEARLERGSQRDLSGDALRLFGAGVRAQMSGAQLIALHSWSDRETRTEVISERRVWFLLVVSGELP